MTRDFHELKSGLFQVDVPNGRYSVTVGLGDAFSVRDNVSVYAEDQLVGSNLTKRLLDTAQRARIPVVGVTETEPPGVNYQDWMLMQLNELQNALADLSK